MRRVTYLRLASGLPLIGPFLGVLVIWAGFDVWLVPGIVIGSLLAGVPYTVAAGVALLLLRNQPPRAYWLVALAAPFLFVPIFGVCLPLISLIEGSAPPDASTWIVASGTFALFILPLGYFYVLISWLGYRWCEWCGLFEDVAQQGAAANGSERF